MSASESEPEVRERLRTFIKVASKKEIEESLPLIPEVKYPDLKVEREDSPMFKVCRLTPAEERALFGPPPSWVDLTVEEEEEHRSKEIEEKIKRSLADCKALEGPPPGPIRGGIGQGVKPSRGSQTEGKHQAFKELTKEAFKEYLREKDEERADRALLEYLNENNYGEANQHMPDPQKELEEWRRNNLRICEPPKREQMIRESIQNYPECSNFTIQGRPLSDDQMKNIMADGFQSARAMHRKNQKVEVIDLTKNDDN